MNFEEKMVIAQNKCEGNYVAENFYSIYPFATENISGYISKFDLENKSLLTVGSSGDQVINAALFNCKDIDVVDICPFTKFYFYLKKAALLTLSYKEFLSFFCYKNFSLMGDNSKSFKKDNFIKILAKLKELDYESYLFWDKLFSNYKPLKIRKKLFNGDEYSKFVLTRLNPYLYDNIKYEKVKSKIVNINPNFIIDDITNIQFNRRYDNIWLSNIGQYMHLDNFKKIIDKLNLNDEGKLLLCYLYMFGEETYYNNEWSEIYNLDDVYKVFKNYNIFLESFLGVNGLDDDSIVLCKKRKNFKV